MTEESPPAEYSVVDDNDFALRGRIGDMMVPTLFAGCENGRSYLFKEFIPATNGTDSILFGKRIVFLVLLGRHLDAAVSTTWAYHRKNPANFGSLNLCAVRYVRAVQEDIVQEVGLVDANGIGLCGRCSIVHTDPTLGVGPSAFALENLKQGLTGCTECSGCDHQAVLCRVGGRTSDQRDIQFESIPLEFGRDVSVQTPYHKYTQEVLVKVFGASYPRIILEGSQSPAILTNDLQEYLKKFKPHAIVLKLGYHDTRVSNAEQFAANLEWLLSMIDEELNADVPFTGRSFRAVQGSYTEPKVLLVGPQYINHQVDSPYANITNSETVLGYQKAMIQQAKRREHVQFLGSYEVSSHECLRNAMKDRVHSQLMYEWLTAAVLQQLEVMLT